MSEERSMKYDSYLRRLERYGFIVVSLTLYHFACNNPETSRPAATRPDTDSVAGQQAALHPECVNPKPMDEPPDIQPGDNATTKKTKRLYHYLKHRGMRDMQNSNYKCYEFYEWVLKIHAHVLGAAPPGFISDAPPPLPGPW